jgi:sulfite oxidase
MRPTDGTSRRQFLRTTSAIAAAALVSKHRCARAAEGDLIVRSQEPFNAEPALLALLADRITPTKHFFVRNHGPVPKVNVSEYKVRIEGMVERPLELSLAELKERFRQTRLLSATLTCAGNRRQEMSAIKPVGGVQWDAGAIGNARWTGAALSDVLRVAEIKEGAKHVWFEGLDPITEKDGSVAPFGGSIPLEKALSADAPVLLAHAMNDQPLTAEHGYPLRTIVPGYIGARSVKWLANITISDRPSPNHYVAEAYKIIQTESKEELAAASPIYAFPVNAAICEPNSGGRIRAGRTKVRGYALPSGDARSTIAKVEVSRDGGISWLPGELTGGSLPFAWQQWSLELDLAAGRHDLVVRATDSRGNTMPERTQWNAKGYLYNGWHQITIEAT